MGNFFPVFLAFVLNCYGVYVFLRPKENFTGPFLSTCTFMAAAFILLWDARLYPVSLRKLGRYSNCFLELWLSLFLLEHLVFHFWQPLEESVMILLPKIADYEDEIMAQGGFECEGILGFLRSENAAIVVSYVLSLFFFFAVLHATRVIDFRLLRCGVKVFVNDCLQRTRRMQRRFLKSIGLAQSKSVKFEAPDPPSDYDCDDPCCNNQNFHLTEFSDCCDCELENPQPSHTKSDCRRSRCSNNSSRRRCR